MQARRRQRFNPIRTLDAVSLAHALDSFEAGNLGAAAALFEVIAERDDTTKSVKNKREKSISQLPWAVLTLDGSPEALAQKVALECFWNNITTTSVWDRNVRGGFARLVRQIMDAVSFRYAVHHIVWQPMQQAIPVKDATGAVIRTLDGFTATFEHVPLQLFENTTGSLRYLRDHSIEGQALEDGEWLVTVGDGLMAPCSICYLFKRMSLQDWVNFNEKFGMPGLHAETSAAKDSPEWEAVVEAAASFMNDWAAVTNQGTKFNLLEAGGAQSMPFPPLLERMDRAIAALYRGADLSTISAGSGSGQGASMQGRESSIIEAGDAAMVTEELNKVDRMVLEWHFGPAKALAYTKVCPKKAGVEEALRVDSFLVQAGARLGAAATLERYNRTPAKPGEAILGITAVANSQPTKPKQTP